MKWYMALNEAGTAGDIGLHTRLAILSAKRHTQLSPHLMYSGEPNAFTEWAQRQGVTVIQSRLPYFDLIADLTRQNRYNTATVGHWLRTNLCLEEMEDEHVLYTDVDVLFLRPPGLSGIRPDYFSAAPEFDPQTVNYFNAGVMVMNVPAMRGEYKLFEDYVRLNIARKTYDFHDQIAYNEFYRGRWNKLPLELNWKPYWGINQQAEILHFYGPKFAAIEAILDQRWNWETGHGRQIGSLFAAHAEDYADAFSLLSSYLPDLPAHDAQRLNAFIERLRVYDPHELQPRIDLGFTKFRMFSQDLWVH